MGDLSGGYVVGSNRKYRGGPTRPSRCGAHHRDMTEKGRPQPVMRASDADREEIARVLQRALTDGRLTTTEADERLASCYAAKFEYELAGLIEDLPAEQPPAPVPGPVRVGSLPRPLVVHAAVVVALSGLLIARWATMPPVFGDDRVFWPIFPIFWLAVSLLVHARIFIANRSRSRSGPLQRGYGRPSSG